MSEELKNKAKNAIGHIAIYADEQAQGEESLSITRRVLWLDSKGLYIAGNVKDDITSHGADIYINDAIVAGTTYLFESRQSGGNYIPKVWEKSSWTAQSAGGKITIDEVDIVHETVKGSFEYTAESPDKTKTAKVRGNFNLRN
ncbi:hypothetical protein [Pseudomonas moraviensis]|uniref:hypothetical protein n=1 Tax=Pseudomonas moraviensis TaxID=321662 RepID=UPI002490D319|nr:hypothetical protein [Pseudomonas moraviensis]GLH37883.1 hypothetical protein RS1P1_21660 [Pseudomonas moraviensis]